MQIRPVKQSDSKYLIDLFFRLDEETDFMLFEPGERKITLGKQQSLIEQFEEDPSRFMFVAGAEKIVGFCVLIRGKQNRVKHIASLVMGVQKEYWRKGVGSSLMNEAIKAATQVGIIRIELTVHSKNQAAIALYKRFGFKIEGERKSSINLNGQLVNEYFMARIHKD